LGDAEKGYPIRKEESAGAYRFQNMGGGKEVKKKELRQELQLENEGATEVKELGNKPVKTFYSY